MLCERECAVKPRGSEANLAKMSTKGEEQGYTSKTEILYNSLYFKVKYFSKCFILSTKGFIAINVKNYYQMYNFPLSPCQTG